MRRHVLSVLLLFLAGLSYGGWPGPDLTPTSGVVGAAYMLEEYDFDTSGVANLTGAMACWSMTGAVGATVSDGCGSYDLTVNGTPVREQYAGTWPNGLSGTQGERWYFDGSGGGSGCLSLADGSGGDDFDFGAGPFTVAGVAVLPDVVGNEFIISKHTASGNQYSWGIRSVGDDLQFTVSDDGTSGFTTVTKADVIKPNCPFFFAVTYDGATTTANLYFEEETVATNSSMDSSIHNSTAALQVAGVNDCAAPYTVKVDRLLIDDTALSSSDIEAIRGQWRGLNSDSSEKIAVASASPPGVIVAPPDSGAEPFVFCQYGNTTQVGSPADDEGGVYIGGPTTNKVQKASFESCTGGDPDGWTVVEVAGDGSSNAVCDTSATVHQAQSVKLAITGTSSRADIFSACITDLINQDVYLQVWLKCTTGTCDSYLSLIEYDNNDCTSTLIVNNAWSGNPGTTWVRKGGAGPSSWHVNTSSWNVRIRELGDGGVDLHADVPMAFAGDQPTDLVCACDTLADCACSLLDITHTPVHSNPAWQVEMNVRSPIDGAEATPVRTLMTVPGTAGDNNKVSLSWASDTLTCTIYNSSGSAKTSTVSAAGDADVEYAVKFAKDGNIVRCCWEGTCDATPATVSTDGVGSETIYGSDGSTGGEVWINNVVWKSGYTP